MRTKREPWQLFQSFKRVCLLLVFLAAAGCGGRSETTTPTMPGTSSAPTPKNSTVEAIPTLTLSPTSTPTPEPLAAIVNGEPITMAEFTAELGRYQRAKGDETGTNLATEGMTEESIVIQALIDQVLLSQGAEKGLFVLDNETLESRYAQLSVQTDLPSWLKENGYTENSFRLALARSIKGAWMRDKIVAEVPESVEQVHARQILLYNSEEANQVYTNLQAGADFDRLAAAYDPTGLGDIGWFPRGYLTELAVEEAAFSLQSGEMSTIVETRLGYHIIKIIERDPERLLEPDALFTLQAQAVSHWLEETRAQSEIEVQVP